MAALVAKYLILCVSSATICSCEIIKESRTKKVGKCNLRQGFIYPHRNRFACLNHVSRYNARIKRTPCGLRVKRMQKHNWRRIDIWNSCIPRECWINGIHQTVFQLCRRDNIHYLDCRVTKSIYFFTVVCELFLIISKYFFKIN